jgi:2-phosphoglycerate kinase
LNFQNKIQKSIGGIIGSATTLVAMEVAKNLGTSKMYASDKETF